MTANSPVWEPEPAHAVDGRGRTYVHHGNAYQIEVFDPTGRLVRRIRRRHEPVRVTSQLFDRYAAKVRTFYDTAAAAHGEWEISRSAGLGQLSLPRVEHVPALGRMLVSRDGALWVERPDLVSDPVLLEWTSEARPESVWDVFSADGEYMGAVELPPTFTPRAVTVSTVVGILRDEMDVQYVARYRIAPAGQ